MDATQVSTAVSALVLSPPDEGERMLAERLVRRLTGEGAGMLLAALGLDGAEPPVKCGTCGYKRTSRNHQVLCS